MRQAYIIGAGVMTGLAFALAGCGAPPDGGLAEPPRAKPATLPVKLDGPTEDTSILAGVSTKSGELLILENDGSVTRTRVDSTLGRQTLRQSDEVMFRLSDVLVEDHSIPAGALPAPPRAQDIALEEFAARRQPALPARITRAAPEAFLGGTVTPITPPGTESRPAAELVSVQVRLQQGVDESTAFAYATCTLAAWSKTTNTPYARHIRTISRQERGQVVAESIFTMSRAVPIGLRVMEQEKTLRDCGAHGIPARVAAVGPVKGTE
ncbi:MAG: hypothetical protein Q4G26_15915 [Paracoccus sp. (in: a-proteobacteria)]|nr:hypothetical protein [Paracoccus sp. (in: a-proteobacteria)]